MQVDGGSSLRCAAGREFFHLMRSVRWMLLICLVVGSALGICGCAGLQEKPVSSSSVHSALATPPVSLTDLTPLPEPTASVSSVSGATLGPYEPESSFVLRGVWVHPQSLASPEKVDETLNRVMSGNFNAVFPLIFLNGYAYYSSEIAERRSSDLGPNYDSLGYFVSEARRRDLQVHAWFVVGRVGVPYGDPGPVLSQHPEWAMLDAAGGSQIHWLNFARPDARQFIISLVLEVVQNYDVDGVHLDYIRYPGPTPKWSFDPYSVSALSAEYDVDLDQLRYARLPAYGFFHGNPLVGVDTAQVLAKFDNDIPAILMNVYGRGKAVVLNWHAEEQQIAASSEILKRSVEFLLGKGGKVYLFRSDMNEAQYTATFFEQNAAWLENLGWEPIHVREQDLAGLDAGSVLVLPNIYVMEASTAVTLARFAERGGGLVFIDGPVGAMNYGEIRAVTGMRRRGGYFRGERLLLAVGESELIPGGGQTVDVRVHQEQVRKWDVFRTESVNELVRDTYRKVKAARPEVQVSAAVFRRQSWASDNFQDWYGWLAGGYVDFVVPMAYVSEASSLEGLVDEWQTSGDIDRTVAGLKATSPNKNETKTPEQILAELELCRQRGIRGIVIFRIEEMSEQQLEALAAGPFAP